MFYKHTHTHAEWKNARNEVKNGIGITTTVLLYNYCCIIIIIYIISCIIIVVINENQTYDEMLLASFQ